MRLIPSPTNDTDTRERILAAALDVFAAQGYRGASIRTICRRAGVNAALLNYHWGTKQAIWEAVCAHCSRWVLDVVQWSVRMPLVPEQVLDDVVGGLFDALVADPRPARILTWAVLQADSMDFAGAARTFQPLIDLVHRYTEGVQSAGGLAGIDVKIVLGLLQGLLVFQFVDQPSHRWTYGTDFADAEHAARVKTQVVRSARLLLGGSS